MPSAQVRNADHNRLHEPDFLNRDDKNVSFYGYNSSDSLNFVSGIVNINTTAVNTDTNIYSLGAGGILTLLQAGVYEITFKVTVAHFSGSATMAVVLTLDEDPDTGVWTVVPGSTTYFVKVGIAPGSGTGVAIVRVLPDYRYRIAVARATTTDSIYVTAQGSCFSVKRLYSLG